MFGITLLMLKGYLLVKQMYFWRISLSKKLNVKARWLKQSKIILIPLLVSTEELHSFYTELKVVDSQNRLRNPHYLTFVGHISGPGADLEESFLSLTIWRMKKDFTAGFISLFQVPPLRSNVSQFGCGCSSSLIIKVWKAFPVVVFHLLFISHLLSCFFRKSGMPLMVWGCRANWYSKTAVETRFTVVNMGIYIYTS